MALETIVLVLKLRHPAIPERRIREAVAETYADAFRGKFPISEVVRRISDQLDAIP